MNIQNLPNPSEIEAVLGLDGRSLRRKWFRRFAWLAVVAAAAVGLAWWYLQVQSQTAITTYETAPAARADLTVTVTATGKIQPTTQVDVSSELSGVVRSVNVDNNSLVKRGDVLAELDTSRLMAQLARAEATVASAVARVADARATMAEREQSLARIETLNKKGISAGQDLDAARAANNRAVAAIAAAEAEVAVVKADLVLNRTDIEKSRIVSPIDGIVLKRSVEPGQTVASSLQAPVLFTLAEDLKRMQVEADVDEADIGAVKNGQEAAFTVDAYPGKSFPAAIETIQYSPQVTDNVVTYKAVLTVDNGNLLLRPGMTAMARIVVQKISAALTVPNAALRYAPPAAKEQKSFSITSLFLPRMPRPERKSANTVAAEGKRTLWILDGGAPRQISVTTGASDGKITEILDGELTEGALTITAAKPAGK